ncbi:response regulator [Dongia sp.]|uniref:response regulator n=1 Tax=Dongia sp. TaxID=1977262 RepID=UPI0035AF1E9C
MSEKRKILVIDDDPAILRMIDRMLADAGYECLAFSDAKEGLACLGRVAVHLIVTDILMPGMEGIELILNTHALLPELPIIAISGGGRTDRMDVLHMAHRLGAVMILPKPFTRAELLGAIDTVLAGA